MCFCGRLDCLAHLLNALVLEVTKDYSSGFRETHFSFYYL